jgi:uncharacterized protein
MTPAHPWIQTGSGIAFDLVAPTRTMINFDVDIAEALARLPRFTGHIRSGCYSVAQHSIMGADALHRETGRDDIAAAFLLHDAHEAYVGDMATPVAAALAFYAGVCGVVHSGFKDLGSQTSGESAAKCAANGLHLMKEVIDRAIFEAAGIAWPLPADIHRAVKEMDLRMLTTERRHLLGPSPAPWHASVEAAKPIRLVGKMSVWPWPDAADAFRERLTRYIPAIPVANPPQGEAPSRSLKEKP